MTREEALTILDQELKKGGYTRDDCTPKEIETTIQMILDSDKTKWWWIKWLPTTSIIKTKIYIQKFFTWLLTLATKS